MNSKTTKTPRLVDYIYEIHQNIGERPAGSREEKLAARHLKTIFSQFTEEVSLETFFCISRRKQHLLNLSCICYALALFAYLLYPPATIVIICLTIISYILLKFSDIDIFSVFFKRSKSQNVIAKIMPLGESKNILIFSAHIDSPYILKIFEGNLREYAFKMKYAFQSLFIILFMVALFNTLNFFPSAIDYLFLLPFAGLGFTLYYQNLMVTYDKSFGANDNLSGVSVLLGLAEYFSENQPDYTEIWLSAFGAEEPGSTGSKYFIKTHFKEIREKAWAVNLDSVAGGALYVVTKEYESGINHSKNLVSIINQAAKNVEISIYDKALRGISTDADPFSFEKIPATTLISLDKYGIPLRYHVKEDLPQYISEEALQDTFKICVETARLIDERTKK